MDLLLYITLIICVYSLFTLMGMSFEPKEVSHSGMKIGYLSNKDECYIIFTNKPPLRCNLENNKIYTKFDCDKCGANLVRNYKCAYCNKKL